MTRCPVRRALPVVCLALAVACLLGCGPRRPKLYPVCGQVHYAGKPAAGALVVFHPTKDSGPNVPLPSAEVKEDGSFALGTYGPGDGAPAGEYRVAIQWTDDKSKADPLTGEVRNRLPERYSDPKSSPLTARVAEGATDLQPFQLTK